MTTRAEERKDINSDLWVDRYGDLLYRFALVRVKDPTAVEDLVQETFLAALRSAATFRGSSSEQTWLIGILKHKIIDHFRAGSRAPGAGETISLDGLEETGPSFNINGMWKSPPRSWTLHFEKESERSALRSAMEGCLENLPEKTRRIFLLREMDEVETEELCKAFGITPTNLWVILHRARFQMRNCLEKSWFKS